ncbi:ankyrin [Aspergillus uvarum CBS 121591]|uniref:Ankyrin n=1 Tax=Aspergillus uvarum CBS 121591 TaxID=1448315 RepID=A0A319CR28_9EURO|nr:ankyrin [Aspergillus uvarum CBS 121591]PYH87110.1 ankyrin [Aspergillus uvarum CBS 121591]
MKSRIAELERENSFLRQQARLLPLHASRPPAVRCCSSDLSSLHSAQWDPTGEFMVLEASLLPDDNQTNFPEGQPERRPRPLGGEEEKDEEDIARFQLPEPDTVGGDHQIHGLSPPPSLRSYDPPPPPRSASSPIPMSYPGVVGPGEKITAENMLYPPSQTPPPPSQRKTPSVSGSATNALHLATVSGNAQCVEILLEHGFDFNSVDSHGRTALMLAASMDSADLVRTLLVRGADSSVCTPSGHTALEIAAQLGNANALAALLGAVARRDSVVNN